MGRSSKSSKRSRSTAAWIIGPSRGSVILGALALWSPSGSDLVHGTLAPVTAVVRFGLAIAVAWLALDLLRRVVQFYSRANSSAERNEDDVSAATRSSLNDRPAVSADHRPASRLTPVMNGGAGEADAAGGSRLEIRRRGASAPSP